MYIFVYIFLILASSCSGLLNPWSASKNVLQRKTYYKTSSFKSSIRKVRFNEPLNFKVAEVEDNVADSAEIEFQTISFDGGILNKLSKGLVPIAASIGFAVSPSSGIAGRAAGAAIGGVAGYLVKSMTSNQPVALPDNTGSGGSGGSLTVSTAVANAIESLSGGPPLHTLSIKQIESRAKKSKVPVNALSELYTHLFADVVYNAIQNDELDFMDLSEVADFAHNVRLSPAEIGNGFGIAVGRIGHLAEKDDVGFYTTESLDKLLLQATKALFIGEKMVGLTGYFGKRLLVSLSLFPLDEYKIMITDICNQLYKRIVNSVLANPKDFSSEEITRIKSFLTSNTDEINSFRPANMENTVVEALRQSLDSQLNSTNINFMDAKIVNIDKLYQAQELLGWQEREFQSTVALRTMPIFQKAARRIINDVVDEPHRAEELASALEERANALNIDLGRARIYLTTLVSDKNYDYMDMIAKVYNSSDNAIEPAFKIMAAYAVKHDAMKKVLENLMKGSEIPLPGLPFVNIVRASLYRYQIESGKDTVPSDLFALNDESRKLVQRSLTLPKISSWISTCLAQNNFDPGAKAAYQSQLVANEVTPEEWRATAIDFYYQEASKVAESRAVPSEADMARLDQIKVFLDCSEELVSKVTLELFGDKYLKALTESMMPAGIITSEYVDGLERLRNRLRLTVEDGKTLLSLAARQRLIPVIKDLADQWRIAIGVQKRKEDPNAKDKSGDPISSLDNVLGYMETGSQKEGGGPNVFMREALNLVDFFIANGIIFEDTVQMPVTATKIINGTDLVGMFKHYIVTRLSEQDPELRARYIEAEPVFASILGVFPEDQIQVRESLAYTAYRNMLRKAFRFSEGEIGVEVVQQFVSLRDSLGISQESASKIQKDASRSAVIEYAAGLFRDDEKATAPLTPEVIAKFRTQATSVGVSLKTDAGFNDDLLAFMFASEIQSLIEKGEEADIADLLPVYDLSENAAEAIVAAACRRYVSQLTSLALLAARKYKETESVEWTKQMLKYAVYFEGPVDADGLFFTEADKDRLISFYESEMNAETGFSDAEHESVLRLRDLIHLNEDFSPPKSGIAGLLAGPNGIVKSKTDLKSEKKKWAWN